MLQLRSVLLALAGLGRLPAASALTCPFCQGSAGPASLADPSKEVYGRTCSDWQAMARNDTDERRACGEFEYVGSLCGCDNSPPEDGCEMCPGGASATMSRAERELPPFDFFGYQLAVPCSQSRVMVQYTYPNASDFCPVQRSVMASYCGCPNPDPMTCPLCGDGMEVSGTKMAPGFVYESERGGNATAEDAEYSCLDAEYVANLASVVGEAGCGQIRDQVAGSCCVEALPADVVSEEGAPPSGTGGEGAGGEESGAGVLSRGVFVELFFAGGIVAMSFTV